ncbi:MAG: NTP transferase domain-containing protein [Herpetosiphonaceae bacterium]|nr:NTP transferase domain-containing protein [Herpetosiphonaceae bacterium]
MKAVVMAGGEGSRLRPLTINRPKPMVPLADRQVLGHIVELLKLHGITEIVMTVQYLANIIQDVFGDGSAYGVHITYSVEERPLGTAGSVKNAAHLLDEPFLVVSGDALTDVNLTELIAYHQAKKALATLTLKHVPNPLEYGVIITDDNGCIQQFVEKPSWGEVFSDTVNTGIYVLDPQVLEYVETGRVVDWSQDVFPAMLQRDQPLYGYVTSGYWTDIGTIEAYQRATSDYLSGKVLLPRRGTNLGGEVWSDGEVEIAPDAQLHGPVFLGQGVKIKGGVMIYGPTVIRDYTIIDTGAHIDRSIIWRNSYIGERAELLGAIVTRQCNIKSRALLYEGTVIGDQTVIGSGAVIQPDVRIWPSKEIDEGATVSTSLIWGSQGRRVLFGRYGITGLVNVDITPEFCAKLGAAFGGTLPRGSTVLINRDAHYSPRMLKRAIVSGLPSSGANVLDSRSLPIPVARFLVRALGAAAGVHVRLSPFDSRVVDIKFFDKNGLDLDTTAERKIESIFFREDYRRVYLDEIGRITYVSAGDDRYIESFLSALSQQALAAIANDFNIVVDYANADSSGVLPAILRRLQCDVVELNANLDEARLFQTTQQFDDGMEQLCAIVPVLHAEFGVRIDPGGEKIFIVDDRGRLLNGLQLLATLTELAMRCYGPCKVAVPVTAPRVFEAIAARHGGTIVRTKTAASALMTTASQDPSYALLGDAAGNLIMPSFNPVADGLFATVKLMELLALQNIKLSDVVDSLPPYHVAQTKVSCRWEHKGKVMRMLNERFADRLLEQIDGIKIDLGEQWVLILPDPEGPFFHVMSEGTSDDQARDLIDEYAAIVTSLQ